MANTVISLDTNIDLIEKYKSLMEASADGDSLYIRAREVVNALKADNLLTSEDEGAMIAQVVAQLSGSISGQAMGTALDWGHREKQLVLQKEELEYKIDMMKIEKEKMEFDRDTSEANKHYTQAKIIREMGVPTIVNGDVVSLNDSGKFYREERILEKDLDIKTNQNIQVQSQTKEVQARVHKLVADTYVNHGVFNGYTLSPTGLSGVTRVSTGYKTLSELNAAVGAEQAKGYVYNAWANAVSSSASMLATLISTESNVEYTPYLTKWNFSKQHDIGAKMKVAVNIQTKKIVDILPDNADESNGFIRNNGYVMLDIENPISNHIENEDGTISTTFRELTSDELLPYTKESVYKRIEELEISLLRPMRELLSTVTSEENKGIAQIKIDTIESEITTLRNQLKE